MSNAQPIDAALIEQAHQLYCQLTGQTVRLDFNRQRQWYELLRQGHSLAEVRAVLLYLQREIRARRRYVGALKLSNLLQPDRFEEDLQISQVRLRPPPPARPLPPPPTPPAKPLTPDQTLTALRHLKAALRSTSH